MSNDHPNNRSSAATTIAKYGDETRTRIMHLPCHILPFHADYLFISFQLVMPGAKREHAMAPVKNAPF
jgi:hypothetical protein